MEVLVVAKSTTVRTCSPDKGQMEESEIISAVLAGDRNAFRSLVEAHQTLVYAMIYRSTRNEELSKELTQETFLKAFTKLRSFRGDAAFSTWLVQIALNTMRSKLASTKYKHRQQAESFDAERHAGTSDAADIAFEKREQMARLRRAIAALKPMHRDVVTLCALEGKSYEYAAEVLSIPLGTVRSRLNKARLLLRASLEANTHE